MLHIIILACHQVSATKVKPFDLGQPFAELLLNVHKGILQCVRARLAVAVAMEALDSGRELIGQQVGCDTETATGSTGVVELGLNLGVLGVDADSARYRVVGLGPA